MCGLQRDRALQSYLTQEMARAIDAREIEKQHAKKKHKRKEDFA